MRKKRFRAKSQLLEQCVRSLTLCGFQVFDSYDHFRKSILVDRCVILNFPHNSLYGTKGRKEALIIASTGWGNPCEDGKFRYIVEAKYQDVSGSVDEKFPYIYESCLTSPFKNWIVILDGYWWKSERGKKAVDWLKRKSDGRLTVVNHKNFLELVEKTWRNK